MALFITLEGGEGSGKSTQAKLLHQQFKHSEIPSILIYEPGVTDLGEKINGILKWAHDTDISPVAELLLFNASRAQLVSEVIKPALAQGTNVICDRYADSTTAYQGYGRGLDLETVEKVNEIGRSGLVPDITFLLDIPVEQGLARIGRNRDRFEIETIDFHKRIREGYQALVDAEPQRWVVINAAYSKEKIAEIIWEKVQSLLPK